MPMLADDFLAIGVSSSSILVIYYVGGMGKQIVVGVISHDVRR